MGVRFKARDLSERKPNPRRAASPTRPSSRGCVSVVHLTPYKQRRMQLEEKTGSNAPPTMATTQKPTRMEVDAPSPPPLRRGRSRTQRSHNHGGISSHGTIGAGTTATAASTVASLPSWARLIEPSREPRGLNRNSEWLRAAHGTASSSSRQSRRPTGRRRPRPTSSHRNRQRRSNVKGGEDSEEEHDTEADDDADDVSEEWDEFLRQEDSCMRTYWYHTLARELDVFVQREVVAKQVLEEIVRNPAAQRFFGGTETTTDSTTTSARSPHLDPPPNQQASLNQAHRSSHSALHGGDKDCKDDSDNDDEFASYFSLQQQPDEGPSSFAPANKRARLLDGSSRAGSSSSPLEKKEVPHGDDVGPTRITSPRSHDDDPDASVPTTSLLLRQRQLPVLVVQPGPYDALDRQALYVPALVRAIRESRPRTCVVWLDLGACDDDRSGHEAALANNHHSNHHHSSNSNQHHPWKKELLRQCYLQQQPSSLSTNRVPDGQGWTDRIVEWARRADRFDDICVVVTASGAERNSGRVGGSSAGAMQREVLQWMGCVRLERGVPLKAVLLGPPRGATDLSLHTVTSTVIVGWDVTSVRMASPRAGSPRTDAEQLKSTVSHVLENPSRCHHLHCHLQCVRQRQHPTNNVVESRVPPATATIHSMLELSHPYDGWHQDSMNAIRDVHSNSLARSAMSLKQALARSLLRPASFVLPMLASVLLLPSESGSSSSSSPRRPTLPRDQLKRLQWFLLHPMARKFLMEAAASSAEGEQIGGSESTSSTQILEQLAAYAGKLEIASRLGPILCSPAIGARQASGSVEVAESNQARRAVLERLQDLRHLCPKQPQPVPNLLIHMNDPTWRWLFSRAPHSHASGQDPRAWSTEAVAPRIATNLRQCLNQLIVAIGEFPLDRAISEEVGLEMLSAVIERSLFSPGERPALLHPTQLRGISSSSGERGSTHSATSWTFDPQFRRDLVAGLVLEASHLDVTTSASSINPSLVAGVLYTLILSIVSISEAEWFALWQKWWREHQGRSRLDPQQAQDLPSEVPVSIQGLFDRFRCGVLQLQYLGLVRERRASHINGKTMYEKPVLVWCGGD
jgi:hypothetical protein